MSVPAVPSAVQPWEPPKPKLPPGWQIIGWDIAMDRRFANYRAVRWQLDVRFWHERGAQAQIRLSFTEPGSIDDEWLERFLLVAQDVPDTVDANIERPESRW